TAWRFGLETVEQTAREGGRMFAQVHSRALNVLISFETATPFDAWDVWRDVRKLPLAEQKAALRDAETRAKLVGSASLPPNRRAIGAEARPPEWDWVFLMDQMPGPHPSLAELSRRHNKHPVELMIDLALERDLKRFFLQPIANEDQAAALELIRHPR